MRPILQPLGRQKANCQRYYNFDKSVWLAPPNSTREKPKPGWEPVFSDPREPMAKTEAGRSLLMCLQVMLFYKLLLAELPHELSGPRAPKCPKPLRKGKGGRQEQLLPVGPVFSRTRPGMRNRRERGDEEHTRIQLRQTRGLLVHFLQARQPPGPAQNQRPHWPLFL